MQLMTSTYFRLIGSNHKMLFWPRQCTSEQKHVMRRKALRCSLMFYRAAFRRVRATGSEPVMLPHLYESVCLQILVKSYIGLYISRWFEMSHVTRHHAGPWKMQYNFRIFQYLSIAKSFNVALKLHILKGPTLGSKNEIHRFYVKGVCLQNVTWASFAVKSPNTQFVLCKSRPTQSHQLSNQRLEFTQLRLMSSF